MTTAACEACGGPRRRCACGARCVSPAHGALQVFDEHDLGDEDLFGGGDLELDTGAAGAGPGPAPALAAPDPGRRRAPEADRRAAREIAAFGDPSPGALGAFLYALNARFRLPRLRRALVEARRAEEAGRREASEALTRLARALVAEAHRREMALLADLVGGLYATVGRATAREALPVEAEREMVRVRRAVRSRLQRARASMPDPSSLAPDARGSVPAELLARASRPGGLDDAWIHGEGLPLPSGPIGGDPLGDVAEALGAFAAEARLAELGDVAEAADVARAAVERLGARRRTTRLVERAPNTLDEATYRLGSRILRGAVGLVAAMFLAIGVFALIARLRG